MSDATTTAINTIITILLVPIITILVNWYTKRQERQNALDVAEIASRAENTDAAANYLRTANDMMAPLQLRIETVSKDNLSLQALVTELRAENQRRKQEEERLRLLDQRRQVKMAALETENDRLKARVQSLEKISLQQNEEIKALQAENGRLRAKLDKIIDAADLDTNKFTAKDTQS